MAKYISFTVIVSLFCVFSINAQDGVLKHDSIAEVIFEPQNVFEILTEKDSANGVVNIYQDERIEQLFLDRQTLNNGGEISGYRVQVFSSNIQQTAKAEAFRIKALVEEKFPEKGVYETYSSPFWKVRVGDLRTREDAQELLAELMRAFPNIRREMYIVPDKIAIAGLK